MTTINIHLTFDLICFINKRKPKLTLKLQLKAAICFLVYTLPHVCQFILIPVTPRDYSFPKRIELTDDTCTRYAWYGAFGLLNVVLISFYSSEQHLNLIKLSALWYLFPYYISVCVQRYDKCVFCLRGGHFELMQLLEPRKWVCNGHEDLEINTVLEIAKTNTTQCSIIHHNTIQNNTT